MVVHQVGNQTYNQEFGVQLRNNSGKLLTPLCSATKQYNLTPVS